MVLLHRRVCGDAFTHPQLQKAITLEGFSEPIYTDSDGMQFLIRSATKSVFTYHPATEELVYLCGIASWPDVAKRFGLEVRKKVKRTPSPKAAAKEKEVES